MAIRVISPQYTMQVIKQLLYSNNSYISRLYLFAVKQIIFSSLPCKTYFQCPLSFLFSDFIINVADKISSCVVQRHLQGVKQIHKTELCSLFFFFSGPQQFFGNLLIALRYAQKAFLQVKVLSTSDLTQNNLAGNAFVSGRGTGNQKYESFSADRQIKCVSTHLCPRYLPSRECYKMNAINAIYKP